MALGLTSTRRTAIALGALASGGAVAASVFSQQTLDAFLSLSAKTTGFPAQSLDRRFASSLLQALLAQGASIETLRHDAMDIDAELAAKIVSAWYSGVLPTTPTPTVAEYYNALIWHALGFASAPSACVRHGEWAEAPASNRTPA